MGCLKIRVYNDQNLQARSTCCGYSFWGKSCRDTNVSCL